MRGFARPDKDVSVAGARAQLKILLSGARSLDQFTPEGLARTHRVPVKEIEYELTIARQKRAQAG